MYSPHLESKNIFRTKITKENFLIRIRSSFLCRFIVTLFPEKKKSINQPSNDCKKEWIFLSFCQFFFSNKKKLYWGPRMTPHKELKASTPQEAQYSSTKKTNQIVRSVQQARKHACSLITTGWLIGSEPLTKSMILHVAHCHSIARNPASLCVF